MQTRGRTSKQYFLTLTILFGALLFAQVILAVMAYFLVVLGSFKGDPSLDDTFQFVVPVVVGGGIAASFLLSRFLIQSAKQKTDLSSKLLAYRSAFLIRCALLEGPSLLGCVVCMITGNKLYLAVVAVSIALFVMNTPSAKRITEELELDYKETGLLNDPDAIVTNEPVYH
ncbi:MAG: hypothetical protein U0Y10_12800 [Spirosomataceae bacterium]